MISGLKLRPETIAPAATMHDRWRRGPARRCRDGPSLEPAAVRTAAFLPGDVEQRGKVHAQPFGDLARRGHAEPERKQIGLARDHKIYMAYRPRTEAPARS